MKAMPSALSTDIITNGTDVETAAKAAEDKLNDIFDTMIS